MKIYLETNNIDDLDLQIFLKENEITYKLVDVDEGPFQLFEYEGDMENLITMMEIFWKMNYEEILETIRESSQNW